MCEKEGYIERFYIDSPNDKVDLTLKDMQRYTKTLIEGETNLVELIEQAIKKKEKEDKASEINSELEIVDDEDLSIKELEDKDFEDFKNFIEGEKE